MQRVIASIEARMGSTRLPGKVLKDIHGQPALTRLLNRLKRCESLDGIILATSGSVQDDVLEEWAEKNEIPCHRGSEQDVLSRVFESHKKMNSDVVVEITGDCILLDPEIIDMGVRTFLNNDCDVVFTDNSYPQGMDALVYKLDILRENEMNIYDPLVREHVAYHIVRHPEIYKTIKIYAPKCWYAPTYRFMLDNAEDLEFIRKIYEYLVPLHGNDFGIEEIMSLIKREPHLLEINIACE
jgi:spore coat polysaccharide biosynthesis protein SpsF